MGRLLWAGALAAVLALLVLSFPLGGPPSNAGAPTAPAREAPATAGHVPPGKLPGPLHLPTPDLPPARSHRLGSPRLAVDPTAYYTAEPAPMGIADFGVDPATGVGYRYTTSEFLATTNIDGLTTRNNSLPDPHDLTLQLNANFEVDSGSTSYTYWVQDVAFLNSSTHGIAFIDNVWNMSASGASVYNTTIEGNGTVASGGSVDFYYAQAAYSLAGNDVTLTYPSQVQLAMTVTPHAGRPGVAFAYNDGAGWVTYDNIGIRFAQGYTVTGLVVDGTGYNAAGLFDDAELTLGGPGGGSATQDVGSKMTMSLAYDNGHNLQAVTNAYDFGSDTAEAISNVDPAGAYYRSNGTLYANEPNGAGTLGDLYNRSFVGLLNVTSLLSSGSVALNGTSYGAFVGGEMNLTVAPGTYSVALYATNGSLAGTQRVTIADGAYVAIHFGAPATYHVAFRSDGLASGTVWSVSFNGEVGSTPNSTIGFLAVNGSYGYSIAPIAGYTTTPWSGVLIVAGADVNTSLHWVAFTYLLTFQATGLPAATPWSVRLNSVAYATTNGSVQVPARNGSYTFFVPGVPGYVPSPASGVANVTGENTTVTIAFGSASFAISLTESGLPAGWIWSATVASVTHTTGTNELTFGLPNGTGYRYAVTPVVGYALPAYTGEFNVTGQPVSIALAFTPVVYALVFSETGLPTGTLWSVTIGSTATVSNSSTIAFSLGNGSYTFSVSTAAPYVPGIASSSVSIAGQGGSLAIPFSPVNGLLEGSVSPSAASVYLNGTLLSTPAGRLNLTLLPGSYELTVSLVGFVAVNETVDVRAGGITPVSISLAPVASSGTSPGTAASGSGGLSTLEWVVVIAVGLAALGLVGAAYSARRRRRRRY